MAVISNPFRALFQQGGQKMPPLPEATSQATEAAWAQYYSIKEMVKGLVEHDIYPDRTCALVVRFAYSGHEMVLRLTGEPIVRCTMINDSGRIWLSGDACVAGVVDYLNSILDRTG